MLTMAGFEIGSWTCYRCYAYGFEKSHDFGFSDCDDLHVGWRIFRPGKNTYIPKFYDEIANRRI